MTSDYLDTKVKFLHGFANKIRVQILDELHDREKTVSELMANVDGSQSSISQHLACLKDCGLVSARQDGKYVYYRLRNQKIHDLLDMFDFVLDDVEDSVRSCLHQIN